MILEKTTLYRKNSFSDIVNLLESLELSDSVYAVTIVKELIEGCDESDPHYTFVVEVVENPNVFNG